MALEPVGLRLKDCNSLILPGPERPDQRGEIMRVLLRDEKGFYYKAEEAWSVSSASAAEFKSSLVAMEFARENGFVGAEVVLSFDNPAYDISLPVRAVQGNGRK